MIYPILNKHNLFVICIVICLEAESHEIEDNKILDYEDRKYSEPSYITIFVILKFKFISIYSSICP